MTNRCGFRNRSLTEKFLPTDVGVLGTTDDFERKGRGNVPCAGTASAFP